MSDTTTNSRNVRDDEIDLLDLFRRMGRGIIRVFNAILRGILISLVFIFKRWLPLSAGLLFAIALAVFLMGTSVSYYTSDLVLRSNIRETDEVIAYVNRLQTLINESNHNDIASTISLNTNQARNIDELKAYWIIDNGNDKIPDLVDFSGNHDVYDTTNVRMKDRLNIRVRIKVPQELSNVRDGIIKYINSDPLFRQRNEIRLRQNNEMLARVAEDIQQLDSLQMSRTKNNMPKNGSQMIFLQEQPIQMVYKDIHDLYELKQELEQENNLYSDIVTVLSDFNIPVIRDNGLKYYLRQTIPAVLLSVLLILIIVANSKRLKDVYNKY